MDRYRTGDGLRLVELFVYCFILFSLNYWNKTNFYHLDREPSPVLVSWNSFGSVMNNIAVIYDFFIGGNDYDWYATYTYTTDWEDVS